MDKPLSQFEIYQLAAILAAANNQADPDEMVSKMFDCALLIEQRLDFQLRTMQNGKPIK